MKVHTYTVVCEERDGRKVLSLTAPKRYADMVQDIGVGEERAMKITAVPKRQGNQAMRYYRGVVIPDIADASGVLDPDDYEDVHQALAWKFLKLEPHPLYGYPRRRSTGKDDMSREELSAYIDQCIVWAETSIPGCHVRRPDEVDEDDVRQWWDAEHEKDKAA